MALPEQFGHGDPYEQSRYPGQHERGQAQPSPPAFASRCGPDLDLFSEHPGLLDCRPRSEPNGLYQAVSAPLLPSKHVRAVWGFTMTTLAPDRAVPAARPAAEAEVARRVSEPAAGPDRKDSRLRSDGGTRAWLRRKAVAA